MGVQRTLKLIVVDYVAMGGSFVVDYVATDSGGLMHSLGKMEIRVEPATPIVVVKNKINKQIPFIPFKINLHH